MIGSFKFIRFFFCLTAIFFSEGTGLPSFFTSSFSSSNRKAFKFLSLATSMYLDVVSILVCPRYCPTSEIDQPCLLWSSVALDLRKSWLYTWMFLLRKNRISCNFNAVSLLLNTKPSLLSPMNYFSKATVSAVIYTSLAPVFFAANSKTAPPCTLKSSCSTINPVTSYILAAVS